MSQITTDHQTIRRWAESHGGKPAAVTRTHDEDDVGIIRIMFPDAARSEHEGLTEISWEAFFEEFDQRGLALVYEDDGLFSKVVSRASAEEKSQPGKAGKADRKSGAQKSSGQKSS